MKKKAIIAILFVLILVAAGIGGYFIYAHHKQNKEDSIRALIEITDGSRISKREYKKGEYLDIAAENIKLDDFILARNTKSIESVVLRCDNSIFNTPDGKMEIIPVREEREITLNGEAIKIKVIEIGDFAMIDDDTVSGVLTEDPSNNTADKLIKIYWKALDDKDRDAGVSCFPKEINVNLGEMWNTNGDPTYIVALYDWDTDSIYIGDAEDVDKAEYEEKYGLKFDSVSRYFSNCDYKSTVTENSGVYGLDFITCSMNGKTYILEVKEIGDSDPIPPEDNSENDTESEVEDDEYTDISEQEIAELKDVTIADSFKLSDYAVSIDGIRNKTKNWVFVKYTIDDSKKDELISKLDENLKNSQIDIPQFDNRICDELRNMSIEKSYAVYYQNGSDSMDKVREELFLFVAVDKNGTYYVFVI